ncbi:hypothetical protein AYI68_g5494 [Smittium mucronatum]|uniref:Uncharacterized protein n=1 Tax=Smittium mucronatum TaxID=133383 RepID=A0A1R0GU35_9FUNG|nr:hypothetical protein AYI68_g5494 [Smittium mucronatum]
MFILAVLGASTIYVTISTDTTITTYITSSTTSTINSCSPLPIKLTTSTRSVSTFTTTTNTRTATIGGSTVTVNSPSPTPTPTSLISTSTPSTTGQAARNLTPSNSIKTILNIDSVLKKTSTSSLSKKTITVTKQKIESADIDTYYPSMNMINSIYTKSGQDLDSINAELNSIKSSLSEAIKGFQTTTPQSTTNIVLLNDESQQAKSADQNVRLNNVDANNINNLLNGGSSQLLVTAGKYNKLDSPSPGNQNGVDVQSILSEIRDTVKNINYPV